MKKILFALALTVCAISATQAQSKVAHVKSQTLLDTMPSRKAAIKDIQEIEKAGIKELREMDSAVNAAYMKYQADVAAGKLTSQSVKEYEENRIRRMQQSLEERQQQIDQQLQIMTQEMNVVILDRVKKAVNTVATAKKFNYVIDESTTLYSAGGIDITSDVIVELLKLEAESKKTGK